MCCIAGIRDKAKLLCIKQHLASYRAQCPKMSLDTGFFGSVILGSLSLVKFE